MKQRTGPSRVQCVMLVLALALGVQALGILALGVLAVGILDPQSPRADDDVEGAEEADLFQELVGSQGDGEWRGVLNRILQEKDPAWIEQEIGRLFTDRGRFENQAACAAYTGAYLADHPADEKVLLGEAIVRRAYGDGAFLLAIRSHITKGEGGWSRLLDHAREGLESGDVGRRLAAIWLVSHEDGVQRERVRQELLTRAEADAEGIAQATGIRSRLADEYLGAFERLLGYRFSSVEEAVRELKALQGLDLASLVLELSRRKDLPSAPDRTRLSEYGRRLVDDIVADGLPEGMEEFLDPRRTPYASLRRYAMQKAGQMRPEANGPWGRLLRLVLSEEADSEVLRGALTLLERTGFAENEDEAPLLSAAVAMRLAQRGPDAMAGGDDASDRVRMAKLLGSLRVRSPEYDALLEAQERIEAPVLAEIVRALGSVQGVAADEVIAHYRRNTDDPDRDQLVRVAVVDALGRRGFTGEGDEEQDEVKKAAAALREVLTGDGDALLGRSESPDVRQHAIRSLGSHPGRETAEVLTIVALGQDAAEAEVAIVVLRRAGISDAHAVRALGEVARVEKVAPERRILALQALGALLAAEEGPRALAREGVRSVVAAEGPDEVRLEAARAAVALADAAVIEPLFVWWSETRDDRVAAVLGQAVVAAAKAGGASDDVVESALMRLTREDLWDVAVQLAETVVKEAPRDAMRVVHARVLHARGSLVRRDLADRRADLGAAGALLQEVTGEESAELPAPLLLLTVRVLRAQGDVAEIDPERKAHYLAAVQRATGGTEEDVLLLGLETSDLLQADPLAGLLSGDETKRLAEARKVLRSRLPKAE